MWNKRKRISLVLLTEDSMEQQKMWDLLIHRGRKGHGGWGNVKERRNLDNRYIHWVDFSE